MGECQMPGCREKATMELHRTRMCQDCFEKESARMNDIYESMPE